MRGHDDLRQITQWEVLRWRFDFVNVQRGAGDLAGLDRLDEIGFVDDAAARAIQHAHARFAFGKSGGVEHAFGLVRHRHVHGDEIRAFEDIVQIFDQLDLERFGAREREVRIIGEHLHAESHGALCDFSADAAHPENAEALVIKLDALENFAVPFARLHRGMCLGNFAREGQQHRKGEFSGGDGVATRRVHHHDAALRSGIHVHIIDTDARATDDFQLRGRVDDFPGDFRFRSDHERVGIFDDRQQFGLGEALLQHLHLEFRALLEHGDAPGRDRVANHNFHSQNGMAV